MNWQCFRIRGSNLDSYLQVPSWLGDTDQESTYTLHAAEERISDLPGPD
jgi:hypothetical protein